MQWSELSPDCRDAFTAFTNELTFNDRVQLSKGELEALMRCWLACLAFVATKLEPHGITL